VKYHPEPLNNLAPTISLKFEQMQVGFCAIRGHTLTERQGQQVGSPDEVAFPMGWINGEQRAARARKFNKNGYGPYLTGSGDAII